jgi:uncharacterized membrane protein HdeD (DUF308 family)
MIQLALLLLGVTAGRWQWALLAAAGAVWGALGIAIFIDGLNGITYFPLRAFAYVLLADAAIALLLAPSGIGAQKWLRITRGVSLAVIALLILEPHRAGDVVLAILFGTGFLLDASLRIAAATVVRYAGWRVAIMAGAFELLIAVFLLEPWPTWYAGTVAYCVGIGMILSGWSVVRLALRVSRLSPGMALPILAGRYATRRGRLFGSGEDRPTLERSDLLVHVWTPTGSTKDAIHRPVISRYIAAVDVNGVVSTGHAALEMPPGLYISHYPAVEMTRSTDDFRRTLRATAENDVPGRFLPNYAEEAAGWCESNARIAFRNYDPVGLQLFWDSYRQDNTYNLTNRNCSSTVAHALEAALMGVLNKQPLSSMVFLRTVLSSEFWVACRIRKQAETMAWTPGLVRDYARALSAIADPSPAPWQVLAQKLQQGLR